MLRRLLIASLLGCFGCTGAAENEDLAGVWASYKGFHSGLSGTLYIDHELSRAEIGGLGVPLARNGRILRAQFPGGEGAFEGTLDGGTITGHWVQGAPQQIGQRMASPVRLEKTGSGWIGPVKPRASEYTFYLPIVENETGELTTFLRNPDRNLGVFMPFRKVERQGNTLEFLGRYRRGEPLQTIVTGRIDAQNEVLTLNLPPWRGGSYDFRRLGPSEPSGFHALPDRASEWRYTPPPELEDGWSTATLEDAAIDAALIARMINEQIVTPDDHLSAHRVHGVLMARGGRLVLEAYFHGFSRDTPHDTRSASKSVVSMLIGAAQHAGFSIDERTKVYETLRGVDPELSARKRAMTLEHLLTMSSGFYCDDSDYDAPGNEDALQSQSDQPDWYAYTLDLPMAEDPGARGVYCSVNSNLIGAVLSQATDRPLISLFADLIAKPLGVREYYLGLQPTGEPYFGGGAQWLPRDFMKIAQVMLDGGTWKGRRVIDARWAQISTEHQIDIGERAYGYQWWINTYPYRNREVTAFFAAGNGGQIVMGIPELDLVIAFYGGNYSDAVLMRAQNVLIPEFILPAVKPFP